jgi:hypothetical protein
MRNEWRVYLGIVLMMLLPSLYLALPQHREFIHVLMVTSYGFGICLTLAMAVAYGASVLWGKVTNRSFMDMAPYLIGAAVMIAGLYFFASGKDPKLGVLAMIAGPFFLGMILVGMRL